MVFKEKEDKITNTAWEHLYQRFEQDGLLPEKSTLKHPFWKTAPFRTWAAVMTLLMISVCYKMQHRNTPGKDLQVIHNEANAPTLATLLHDGSIVCLSEQTSLKYPDTFDGNKREVILKGDAFFDVKKNPEQPFFIDTELATVEVPGTSFHVRSDDSFSLSVRDGEVRVSLKDRRQTVSAKAGETVSFHSGRLQLSKTGTNSFDGYFRQIHFKDERLDNIALIINMIFDSVRIKVAPEVESRRITFTLSGNNDIEAICLALNLQYRKQDHTIYISKQE
ncbi:MAG: FecR family protein [Tannerella sp.]|jgi:ferric-dicitrate binding protein FerR (iron transport regulator)|nr:FecR family protein [Tannerella sp.]